MTTPLIRDSVVRKAGIQQPAGGFASASQGFPETQKCCAYNQTNSRFLGLEIDAGDFSAASLDDRMAALTPKSGAGIWLVPFRGISPASVHIPLDLVYLDWNCTVIDVVESFPIYRVSPGSAPAASVLVLPSRVVDTSETKRGDQLILCAPDEMKWRLQRLPSPSGAAPAAQSAVPLKSNGPLNLLQWEDRSKPERPVENRPNEDLSLAQPVQGKILVEPATTDVKPPKSWWQRLLSPDPPQPRKTSRETLAGLTAYFWTGDAPVAHTIQDVSPTGLYVVTDERWYPGTVVRMTLTDSTEPTAERSITVNATAMRWGNDGVGLRFVLQDDKNSGRGSSAMVDGVNKRELDQFLQRLRNGKY